VIGTAPFQFALRIAPFAYVIWPLVGFSGRVSSSGDERALLPLAEMRARRRRRVFRASKGKTLSERIIVERGRPGRPDSRRLNTYACFTPAFTCRARLFNTCSYPSPSERERLHLIYTWFTPRRACGTRPTAASPRPPPAWCERAPTEFMDDYS
jgi:hypothetical protein